MACLIASLLPCLFPLQLRPEWAADGAGGGGTHCGDDRGGAGAVQAPSRQVGWKFRDACVRAVLPGLTSPATLLCCNPDKPSPRAALHCSLLSSAGTRSSSGTSSASTRAWWACCRPTPLSGGRKSAILAALLPSFRAACVCHTACERHCSKCSSRGKPLQPLSSPSCSPSCLDPPAPCPSPLAWCSTGVRLICTNQVGNGARTTVVSTQGGATVRCAAGPFLCAMLHSCCMTGEGLHWAAAASGAWERSPAWCL